jgi:hypothetical protein
MNANSVLPSFPTFRDVDGSPLEAGFLYIGLPNLNPEISPAVVYFDAGLTIPAPQPIRTTNGYPSRNGAPTQLYVDGEYSLTVRNKSGSLVYSTPSEQVRFSPLISGVYDFRDEAAIIADTSSGFGVGSVWRTRLEGFSYEQAPTGATDEDLVTAGGVKLYSAVKPVSFSAQSLSAPDQAQARLNLGLGTAAIEDASSFATAAQGALADTAAQKSELPGISSARTVGFPADDPDTGYEQEIYSSSVDFSQPVMPDRVLAIMGAGRGSIVATTTVSPTANAAGLLFATFLMRVFRVDPSNQETQIFTGAMTTFEMAYFALSGALNETSLCASKDVTQSIVFTKGVHYSDGDTLRFFTAFEKVRVVSGSGLTLSLRLDTGYHQLSLVEQNG